METRRKSAHVKDPDMKSLCACCDEAKKNQWPARDKVMFPFATPHHKENSPDWAAMKAAGWRHCQFTFRSGKKEGQKYNKLVMPNNTQWKKGFEAAVEKFKEATASRVILSSEEGSSHAKKSQLRLLRASCYMRTAQILTKVCFLVSKDPWIPPSHQRILQRYYI